MIIPMLTCCDTAAEIDFCKRALGAAVLSERAWTDGKIIHATLAVGESLFMVHGEIGHLASREPSHDGSSSVVIYLYVEDPDRTIEAAVLAGASVLLPAEEQPWGDRTGRIYGSRWPRLEYRATRGNKKLGSDGGKSQWCSQSGFANEYATEKLPAASASGCVRA